MANIKKIKLPNGTEYDIKDSGALPLTGGTVTGPVIFEDSTSMDEATIGDLVVNGNGSFTNNIQANTINGVTVGTTPKFTDTVTTATTTGSGNAVTAITASNGALTVTKGTTFLTSHQDISGKADKATTLAGYGITDAKISSGTITLGSSTITPLTSSSTLSAAKLSGAIPSAVTATTQASTDNSTKIATTAYVTTAIANLPEPMIFKGSVGTGGTVTSLPTAAAANEGWTYKVITALSSPAAKVGDTVISNGSSWVVIPSGDEPSGTVTSVGVSNGGGLSVSGSPVTSSGTITIGHSNSVTAQTTQAVYPIKIDAQGHISAYGSAVTIPTVPSNIVNTITTTAGAHTAVTSKSGTVSFNVPTKTSHLTNDSGFITSYTDENVKSTTVTAATTNYIVGSTSSSTTTGGLSKHASALIYTTADSGTSGYAELRLGNTTATSSAGGKEGTIRLYGTNATYYVTLKAGAIASSNKTITFPNATGTVALTSDITDEKVKLTALTLPSSATSYYPTFYTATTGTTGLDATGSFYLKILNGTTSTDGYVYICAGNSTASGTAGNTYGGITLYGTNSYNVNIKADSLTANRTVTLPNKTGTVALTSDIPSIPILEPGDSLTNYTIHTASYLTTGKTQINIIVPLGKIITATTFTPTKVSLVTRQGGKYTHGSGSTTYVDWTVETATIDTQGNTIFLSLTTTADANATNNAPIGIAMKLSGTFS